MLLKFVLLKYVLANLSGRNRVKERILAERDQKRRERERQREQEGKRKKELYCARLRRQVEEDCGHGKGVERAYYCGIKNAQDAAGLSYIARKALLADLEQLRNRVRKEVKKERLKSAPCVAIITIRLMMTIVPVKRIELLLKHGSEENDILKNRVKKQNNNSVLEV